MDPTLRIAGIAEESIVDGPGLRLTVFAQGCLRNCPGCQNPQTHDPAGGSDMDCGEILAKIVEDPLLKGVTFSGDPTARLDVSGMVFEKKQLLTYLAEPAENFPLSIELIRSGRVDAGRVITHRLPMDEAPRLAALYGEDSPAIKTVILCGE